MPCPDKRVDATGTRRRIQAACRAGHSLRAQTRQLGWDRATVTGWLVADTVLADVAVDVATLFPRLITRRGPSRQTAAEAARRGWPDARCFTRANIDDPSYDPFAFDDNPIGIHRWLRALAWMGQGPEQVAEFIGEEPEQVAIWLKGGPAYVYARRLVAAAFEGLSGRFGPDLIAAEQARRLDWPPPLAWYDIDVHNVKSRPCYDLARGERPTAHPLYSQVYQALLGRIPAGELLTVEREAVVWELHRAGWSDRRIAAWTRWNPDGDVDKGKVAVDAFRCRRQIYGGGLPSSWSNQDAEDDVIVAPSLT